MLKLRHIEAFAAVMRAGSVSKAAEELHVSQPAVSKTLQHAEAQLGIKLFTRINGRLQPTPEANLLFSGAQEIEEALHRFNQTSRDVKNLKVGELSVTVAPALATAIIPSAVQQLKTQWPKLRLHINVQPNDAIAQHVHYCQTDLGIVHFPTNEDTVEASLIKHGQIQCLIANDHPLSSRHHISAADLQQENIIHCSGGTWWFDLI